MGLDMFTGISFRTKDIQTLTYGHVEVNHAHDEGVGRIAIPVSDHPEEDNSLIVQGMIQCGLIMFFSWK